MTRAAGRMALVWLLALVILRPAVATVWSAPAPPPGAAPAGAQLQRGGATWHQLKIVGLVLEGDMAFADLCLEYLGDGKLGFEYCHERNEYNWRFWEPPVTARENYRLEYRPNPLGSTKGSCLMLQSAGPGKWILSGGQPDWYICKTVPFGYPHRWEGLVPGAHRNQDCRETGAACRYFHLAHENQRCLVPRITYAGNSRFVTEWRLAWLRVPKWMGYDPYPNPPEFYGICRDGRDSPGSGSALIPQWEYAVQPANAPAAPGAAPAVVEDRFPREPRFVEDPSQLQVGDRLVIRSRLVGGDALHWAGALLEGSPGDGVYRIGENPTDPAPPSIHRPGERTPLVVEEILDPGQYGDLWQGSGFAQAPDFAALRLGCWQGSIVRRGNALACREGGEDSLELLLFTSRPAHATYAEQLTALGIDPAMAGLALIGRIAGDASWSSFGLVGQEQTRDDAARRVSGQLTATLGVQDRVPNYQFEVWLLPDEAPAQ